MKSFRFYLFFWCLIFTISCSETDMCEQSDWIGTYSGTVTCEGIETTANVSIKASDIDRIQISYETPSVLTDFDPVPFSDCSISLSSSDGSASLNAELDGDNLTFTEIFFNGTTNNICIVNAERD